MEYKVLLMNVSKLIAEFVSVLLIVVVALLLVVPLVRNSNQVRTLCFTFKILVLYVSPAVPLY